MKHNRNIIALLCFLLTFATTYAQDGGEERSTSASASVVSLAPWGAYNLRENTANGFVNGYSITSNATLIRLGKESGVTLNSYTLYRGYLHFKLPNIPSDGIVTKVELTCKSQDRISSNGVRPTNQLKLIENRINSTSRISSLEWDQVGRGAGTELLTQALNGSYQSLTLSSAKFTTSIKKHYEDKEDITLGLYLSNETNLMLLESFKLVITYEMPKVDPPVVVDPPVTNCNTKVDAQKITSSKAYTGCTIEVLNNTSISNNATVSMTAEESVTLKAPFTAERGTNVSIKIQPKSKLRSEVTPASVDFDLTQQEEISVKVYPNPTNDILNVSSDDVQKIEVYSINGRFVKSVAKVNSIDLQDLSVGIYIVKVTTPSGITSHRVMKK